MLCSRGQMLSLLFLTQYRFHATSTGEVSKYKLLQQLSPLWMFIRLACIREACFKSVQKKERKGSKRQTQKHLETHCPETRKIRDVLPWETWADLLFVLLLS